MKIDDLRQSSNVEDRRGSKSFGSSNLGTGTSGISSLLISLLMRTKYGKWIALLILIASFFGGGSGLFGSLTGTSSYNSSYQDTTSYSTTDSLSDADGQFFSKVLASTEDFWTEIFAQEGLTYQAPTLVIYDAQTQTGGCGVGSASAGPFYCSADKKVYIDPTFYQELSSKYGATGDFAMAYVIAHEVGHHIQNELGTMSDYHQNIRGMSESQANAQSVRLELQADYYAGAWAKYVQGEGLLEAGDIDEAMEAAHAVGDDTLQEAAYGRTVPDSFTHGTSEQRKTWFNRGYKYGDIKHGDTFTADI